MADAVNYEQLDLFYLGREVDPETGEATRQPLLIKSKQLTTHAAIIGMTGSGKTGLGIALLEEAAIDRLPAIVIDPKGDMGNLLLTFPDLAPADFRPWIDPAAAEQKGLSVDELAARMRAGGGEACVIAADFSVEAEAQRAVRQVMALLGALALVLMLVLLLVGPWLFATVFGAQWRDAGELARALAPYIAAHFVAAPLAVVTMAWQSQRWAFRLALVGQAVFLLCLAWGLWTGGLLRGAWAVSAGMVLYFGYYFWRLANWPSIPARAVAAAEGGA